MWCTRIFVLFFFYHLQRCCYCIFFFFNDTATTEIYTLSLHDALPIFTSPVAWLPGRAEPRAHPTGSHLVDGYRVPGSSRRQIDRKSTRLNSSHANISYAVFCLKKKKKNQMLTILQYK